MKLCEVAKSVVFIGLWILGNDYIVGLYFCIIYNNVIVCDGRKPLSLLGLRCLEGE